MITKIYAVDWSHTEEKLSVWDGKKMTHKMPKPQEGMVIVAENIPNKKAKPFLEEGIDVLRCSPNATAEYRDKYAYPKTDDNDAIIIYDLYQQSPQKFRPMKSDSKLRQLQTNYHQLTKEITAVKNRQWSSEDEDNQEYLEILEKAKTTLLNKMKKELKNYKVWTEFMSHVKGLGPALAAGLISYVNDISRFDNVSDLYAYCGVHVKGGKCVRRQKGQASNWNCKLKTLVCELIPDQFIKHRSPVYRDIYDEEKAKSLTQMEEDAKKNKSERRVQSLYHAERRARRKAGKIFLHHFWKKWREAEGLPTPQPWALSHGGHTTEILPPTDYPGHNSEAA